MVKRDRKSESVGFNKAYSVMKTEKSKKFAKLFKDSSIADLTDELGETLLIKACDENLISCVEVLLKNGADVNFDDEGVEQGKNDQENDQFSGMQAAFVRALYLGRYEIVKLLIEYKITIPLSYAVTTSLFSYACQSGDEATFELCLSRGVNINDRSQGDPLVDAYNNKHMNIIELLINNSYDLNYKDFVDPYRNTLICASENNDEKLATLLLDRGADVNISAGTYNDSDDSIDLNSFKASPLNSACRRGHFTLAKFLIVRGADVNQLDGSALTLASLIGHCKLVEWMVEHKAKVNAVGGSNLTTALIAAVTKGHIEVVKLLLMKGADPDLTCDAYSEAFPYRTALEAARATSRIDIEQILLDPTYNVKRVYDSSLLNLCAEYRPSIPSATALLKLGANPNGVNGDQVSALSLHCSRARPHKPLIELMLEHGANPNQSDSKGRTTLHHLLLNEKVDEEVALPLAALLIEKGADPTAVDNEHVSALSLHCSRARPHKPLIELMLVHDADPNQPDSKGRTTLHHLLLDGPLEGKLDLAYLLIVYHADVTRADSDGRTALDLARGCPELLKLCEECKDFNHKDSTALEVTALTEGESMMWSP